MAELPNDVAKILSEAASLDEGPAQVELIQQAVHLADQIQDIDAGFQARLRLQEAALVCGSADVLLVAYTWCLSQTERDPDRFGLYQVLWRYRWAIVYLPTYPEIPRSRIEEALADMSKRYRNAGASLRPVHLLRWKVAMKLGDGPMASEARQAWKRSRWGWLADDEQTERVTQIEYHLFRERWAEAATEAKGYTDGSIRDLSYLDSVLSWMVVPLLRLGRMEEAMRVHERGYRLTIKNAALVTQAARHVQFLGLTHNFPRALRLVERYLPYCVGSDPEDKIEFYPALLTMIRLLRREKTTVRLRLSATCPGYQADGIYDLAELDRVYMAEAMEVANQYDARDGNDYYARMMADLDEILPFARPWPLTRRGSGK